MVYSYPTFLGPGRQYGRVRLMFHQPKKSLGQNFLTSIPARMAIVAAGELTEKDTVLEIGPGKGFLTEGLLQSGAHVIALEKDRDLKPLLEEKFAQEVKEKRLLLVEGDALTYEPTSLNYKLIANIPYYITGAILSRYLSHTNQPKKMVVLVQKEVAERVLARDGKESLLSLSVKCYGNPRIPYRVSKGSFNPVPKVDSAVLEISNISRTNFKHEYHEAIFFKLIHAAFAHKRKFALSNIRNTNPNWHIEALFEHFSLSPKVRAEDVKLESWLSISLRIATQS